MLSADSDASWELLAKHLAGESTPAEEAALRAWAAADPANQALLLSANHTWAQAALGAEAAMAVPVAFSPAEVQHAWQRFETTVLGPAPSGSTAPQPPNVPAGPAAPAPAVPVLPGAGWWVGAGKGLGLLAVGVGTGWLLRTAVPAEPAVVVAPPAAAAAPAVAPVSRSLAPVDLVFEDAPLGMVARRLEGAFPGTHVVVADSALAGQRFTGTFRAAQPAAVLRVVGVATGAALARRPDSTWVLGR